MSLAYLPTASFESGQPYRFRGVYGTIRLCDPDLSVLQSQSGEVSQHPTAEIMEAFRAGDFHLVTPPRPRVLLTSAISDEHLQTISRREAYCVELDKYEAPYSVTSRSAAITVVAHQRGEVVHTKGRKSRKGNVAAKHTNLKSSDESATQCAPSLATLARWHADWVRQGRDMSIQVVLKNKNRRKRLPRITDDLLMKSIQKHYLTHNSPSATLAYEEFLKIYKKLRKSAAPQNRGVFDAPPPSIDTYRRRIRSVHRLIRIEARVGKSAARAEARTVTAQIEAHYPNQRVEVDTAHFNIGLLTDQGHYAGKVALYLVIDVYSRAILGFAIQVGKQGEHSFGAISAMRYAIEPKGDPNYPMCGIFQDVYMDSGPGYNRSEQTKTFISHVADQLVVTPVRMGWAKPFVERLIGTLRTRFFCGLEGYLGKYDPSTYSDETLKSKASMSVNQFRAAIYEFIVNDYHRTPHSGLNNCTPHEKWFEGISHTPPVVPCDLADIRCLRGLKIEGRVLNPHSGIFCDYQSFHSQELSAVYHEIVGKRSKTVGNRLTVAILVDPLDARGVTVIHPTTGVLIDVPHINQEKAAGKSFAEINADRKPLGAAEVPFHRDDTDERMTKRPRLNGHETPLDDGSRSAELMTRLHNQSTPSHRPSVHGVAGISSVPTGEFFNGRSAEEEENDIE